VRDKSHVINYVLSDRSFPSKLRSTDVTIEKSTEAASSDFEYTRGNAFSFGKKDMYLLR